MGCDLGRDPDAARLGLAQHLDRPGRGDVADVQAAADVLGEQHVPCDDRLLGHRGPPGQAEPGRDLALVHLRTLGQPWLLRVLSDDPVERLHVLQGAAHEPRVGHALAVVGENPYLRRRCRHGAQLGQLPSAQADRDRADGLHVDQAGLPAQPPDLLDHPGGVGDRRGVRHRAHRGIAADRRGPRPGLHGLGVLPAGFPQVRVQIDEAGQGHQAGSVDHLVRRARIG